ncbi:DNA-binding MarR family transcriptional regulator [Crossiella equi]|uniref:DNA-binding MarR family transcriptional regulator n=1 Tax=Crossiella equi TaxID=130796 RepID=A0ABS5AJQ3_9PSEU|nr:MarR family transcriptional regulator [Crossiella equi]MBP2476477.1 DNA-binding MarR family transcriptional regulator [Crossiella equi]
MSDPGTARLPSSSELAAWRAFLRAHARITRWLEAELITEQRLSLAAYDVLVQLAESPERQLRMTELAEAVLLSRSGVTRLVDRLERAGLVCRERADGDGRGVVAVLTDRGLDRLQSAADIHLSGISRHFVSMLGQSELDSLGRTCSLLADGELPVASNRRAQA